MGKKKKHKTLSLYADPKDELIFDHMAKYSKNIYNCVIFVSSIYFENKNNIFKVLESEMDTGRITTRYLFYDRLYATFKVYYDNHIKKMDCRKKFNEIVYSTVINNLRNVELINSNYYEIRDNIISGLETKIDNYDDNNELIINNVDKIIRSIYARNFYRTRNEILNNIPTKINNPQFIEDVKNDNFLFNNENPISIKKKINNKFKTLEGIQMKTKTENNKKKKVLEDIHSDQNIITRFLYNGHMGDNKDKLPSDLIINIISKAYKGYTSYFELKRKGIKANMPKYLPKNSKYILPFFERSMKIMECDKRKYVRLTVGSEVANNFSSIIKNKTLVCLNKNQVSGKLLYVKPKYLKKIKKGIKNVHKINGQYISKRSPHITEAYYVTIPLPKKLEDKSIKMIEICPKYDGHKYKINICYEVNDNNIEKEITVDNSISIDLGVKLLMAIYDPIDKQYLINGGRILSINHYYNKIIDRAKSIANRLNNKFTTCRIRDLLIKRENQINNYFNHIVSWLFTKYKHKDTIIIGYNVNWKNKCNMGKKNNREFYNIPYMKLLSKLIDKFGSKIVINEESYTSKCDALAQEPLMKHEVYLGERIRRGLFSSSTNKLINADINAAINIMRKRVGNFMVKGVNIFNPIKITL